MKVNQPITLYAPDIGFLVLAAGLAALFASLLAVWLSQALSGNHVIVGLVWIVLPLAGSLMWLCRLWRAWSACDIWRFDPWRMAVLRYRGGRRQAEYPLPKLVSVGWELAENAAQGQYGYLWLDKGDGGRMTVGRRFKGGGGLAAMDKVGRKISRLTGLPIQPLLLDKRAPPPREGKRLSSCECLRPLLPQRMAPGWWFMRSLAVVMWLFVSVLLLRMAWQMTGYAVPGGDRIPWPIYTGIGWCGLVLGWRATVDCATSLMEEPAVGRMGNTGADGLPMRVMPQSAGSAEFGADTPLTWLLRLPPLMCALGMVAESWGSWIEVALWLLVSAMVAGRLQLRWQNLRKVRYALPGDRFSLYRWQNLQWQPEGVHSATLFRGIYCRVYDSNRYRFGHCEIWLAGKQGWPDILVADIDHIWGSNKRIAARMMARISRATGLPLLEYVRRSGERLPEKECGMEE